MRILVLSNILNIDTSYLDFVMHVYIDMPNFENENISFK